MIRSGAEQLTRDILKLGLHGDQEPAIVDLLKQVAKLRVEEASWGNPNGVAERPVNSVEKMVRVHQSTFENRIGGRLPVKHPLFAWLVEHASDILTSSRRQGWKRRCSKIEVETLRTVCLGPPSCFASAVRWKVLACQRDGTLASRWERDWAQRSKREGRRCRELRASLKEV